MTNPVTREPIHHRQVNCHGFRRSDGLFDIEGALMDTKSYTIQNRQRGEIQPGEPLHEMRVCITIDDQLLIHEAKAITENGPYHDCPSAAASYEALAGIQIRHGWMKEVKARLGSATVGCTHLTELLQYLGTAAFQTVFPLRQKTQHSEGKASRPALLNTCYAYRDTGQTVQQNWPDFYRADAAPAEDSDSVIASDGSKK